MSKRQTEKPIKWMGSSLDDLKDDKIFTLAARKEAGTQLHYVQHGVDPDDWKPFDGVGKGTREIRIKLDDGAYRIMYVAKFEEAVYVLHCFKKKSQATSVKDKSIAETRYREVVRDRLKAKKEKKK